VPLAGSMGLKTMEINLLSNQETTTSLSKTCCGNKDDLLFGSIIKTLSHPFQLVVQVLMACTPTFKLFLNNVRLKKTLSHVTM
jgi:hypothetical protein